MGILGAAGLKKKSNSNNHIKAYLSNGPKNTV